MYIYHFVEFHFNVIKKHKHHTKSNKQTNYLPNKDTHKTNTDEIIKTKIHQETDNYTIKQWKNTARKQITITYTPSVYPESLS